MHQRLISRLFLLCLASAVAGCSTMDLLKFKKDDFPKAGPTNPVMQVVTLWQPGEGIGIDNKTCRGFVGQVLFFTEQSGAPAQVDGAVRVYLFDDQGTPEEQEKPFHQFDFPAETWKHHRVDGKLGLTYGVFVPYTRKGTGRQEANCALRLKFTPKLGPTVFSEMVSVTLPGPSKNKTKNKAEKGGVQDQESPREAANAADETARRSSKQRSRPRDASDENADDGETERVTKRSRIEMERPPQSRKPSAMALTDRERDRILKEAQASLAEERDSESHIERASFERPARRAVRQEPAAEDEPGAQGEEDDEDERDHAASFKKSRKSLADLRDELDSEPVDEAPRRSRPATRQGLREESDEEEDESATQTAARQRSQKRPRRATKSPESETSDDVGMRGPDTNPRTKLGTQTIRLAGVPTSR